MRSAWDTTPRATVRPRAPTPGSTISHYRVLEPIASGGMGVVYKALDLKLDRLVALKLLDPEKAADPQRQRRFLLEARAASTLNHPGIVTVYDVDVVDDRPIIAMELLDGATLRDRIADWPLAIEEVLDVGQQVADALDAAHRKGILHRDVKPSNVLVTDGGQAKILDFGLAKPVDPPGSGPPGLATRPSPLTMAGSTVGTLGYMSPEQARGEPLDARSDLFSLGAVLWEMTTGRPAFDGDTPAIVYDCLLHRDPPPVHEINREAPAGLAAVIARALEKQPARRYASAAEMRDDLRELQRGAPPRIAPPIPPRQGSRLRTWLALAAAVVAVAGGLAAALVLKPRPIRSIAVLPLENLSGNPSNDYFADGMTEALITDLGKVRELRVIARHSVMRFRGTGRPLAEVADELDVDALLVGSVTPAEDRLAVTLHLVEGRSERTLWTERYDRGIRDVLAVQSEIAEAVADRVSVAVSPAEASRIAAAEPVDPVAYRLYLEGRYHFWRMTEASLAKSVDLLERSIAADPDFAPAHAALVDALDLQTQVASLPPATNVARQARAVERALELAPDLADSHAAAAAFNYGYRWDLIGAEAEYRRALELNPGLVLARVLYAQVLSSLGRHADALEQNRLARDEDPLNPFVQSNYLFRLALAGQGELALEEAARLEATFPELYRNHWVFYWVQGFVHDRLGSPVAAALDFQRAVDLGGGLLEPLPDLVAALARSGRTEEARGVLEILDAEAARRHVPPTFFAVAHAALGDRDRAFAYLELALAEHDWRLLYLAYSSGAADLRSDPRWPLLLKRIGIKDVVVPQEGARR